MYSGATQLGPDTPSFDTVSARYNPTCWARSHPERSNVPPNCWDQHQWGIFLADHFGGPQPQDHNPDFPTLHRFSPISQQQPKVPSNPMTGCGQQWDPPPCWAALPGLSTTPLSTTTRTSVTTPEHNGTLHRSQGYLCSPRSSRLATHQEGDSLPGPEDPTSMGPPVA